MTKTKLYRVTVKEADGREMTYLEKTSREAARMVIWKDVVKVEPHSYSLESKLASCERFGNN